MKKQLTTGLKAYLQLQVLRKMKANPEFKKKVIAMSEKNQQMMEEETEQESIRAEAVKRLKVRQLGKQLKDLKNENKSNE